MGMKVVFRTHISPNMYPISGFRVHVKANMYPILRFWVHIDSEL
jgi:hypothetical protein